MRDCWSCGSRANETEFPERGPLCCDCIREADRNIARGYLDRPVPLRGRRVFTRAMYRARKRQRDAFGVVDWVEEAAGTP